MLQRTDPGTYIFRDELAGHIAMGLGGRAVETPRPPRIIVDEVKFDAPTVIPGELQSELTELIKKTRTRALPGWSEELEEVVVRGALQDQGYFRVEAHGEVQITKNGSDFQHVSITLHVEHGIQYRLGELSFRPVQPGEKLVFPPEELRELIPLAEGDLFNVQKIKEGLDALKKHYGANGYIDFVAAPGTEPDDANQRVDLIMQLDQQKQFRTGKVKVLSADPGMQTLLESAIKPGDVYNSEAIEKFFEENRDVLPPDSSPDDIQLENRNVKTSVVDLAFNLLTCEEFRATFDP
jgi:hypothetical protein